MRITVFGSGGVGGYFGARLAAAGDDVVFLARGAHLAALERQGLRIVSPNGNLHLARVTTTSDPEKVGPADVVIFTVKLYDMASAVAQLPSLLGPSTVVIPFQNGVDAVDTLTRALGPECVAGGTTYIVATISEPGVITHTALGRLIFGPLQPSQRPVLQKFHERCVKAGIDATLSERVLSDIWMKFARLTVFSGMTAVTRCPIGPIRGDPELWGMFKRAVAESVAVARARGIDLPVSFAEEISKAVGAMPPESKSSMLGDLERGKPLELPWLSGAIVRIGREVGVPTPTHEFIATVLKPHVGGRQGG
jgi:2-dehydropantoate 2-reductase